MAAYLLDPERVVLASVDGETSIVSHHTAQEDLDAGSSVALSTLTNKLVALGTEEHNKKMLGVLLNTAFTNQSCTVLEQGYIDVETENPAVAGEIIVGRGVELNPSADLEIGDNLIIAGYVISPARMRIDIKNTNVVKA